MDMRMHMATLQDASGSCVLCATERRALLMSCHGACAGRQESMLVCVQVCDFGALAGQGVLIYVCSLLRSAGLHLLPAVTVCTRVVQTRTGAVRAGHAWLSPLRHKQYCVLGQCWLGKDASAPGLLDKQQL